MTSDLLPCPFCGGEGEMSWFAKGDSPALAGYFVECTSCSASGEPFDIQGEMPDRDEYTRQKAITAWNTRAKADQIMGVETARHIDEYHEDFGCVLWWTNPVDEPPYVGSPLSDDWRERHEWWTPCPKPPQFPKAPSHDQ